MTAAREPQRSWSIAPDAALYEAKAAGRDRAVIAKADRVPPT